jgi:hypothetical protein
MAQLSTKIKLYTAANGVASVDFQDNVKLQDNSDGNGAFIAEWNLDIAEPTAEQLASYETAGNTEEANDAVKATRKSLYGALDKQLEEIYDNGIDNWKARITQIKIDNPKT